MRSFEVLSDYEFEGLVADLVSASLGRRFQRYAPGRDRGVDLRCWASGDEIIQCKHYPRSKFSHLIADLQKEVPKVEALNPVSYRVVTSLELTEGQVSKVVSLFAPWMPDPSYVLDNNALDSLLIGHPAVERRYTKLYLSTGTQLQAMLRAGTTERSSFLLDEIDRTLPTYVHSNAFNRARRILSQRHAVILAGPPGIGKSTIARMLVANLICSNWEPIAISEDIEEAWSYLDPSSPQVFYYDDFLGRIAFTSSLRKNEDRRLSEFVRLIAASDSKRLVLTTREYILENARLDYDELDALSDSLKVVVKIKDYSRFGRARILYNHLWHSDLTPEDLASFLDNQAYMGIVDHPNFSPRLVEIVTSPRLRQVLRGD